MPIDYLQLKSEIQNDPRGYGYATHLQSGSTQAIADLLNVIRDGTNVPPSIVRRRSQIVPSEVLEAIDNRDFLSNLNSAHVAWFESVTQLPSLRLVNDDGTDTRILGNLKRMLENPGTQGSRERLTNLANRFGSRSEELFGTGISVTSNDVVIAINS